MEAVFRNVPLVDHIRISDFGIRLKFKMATRVSNIFLLAWFQSCFVQKLLSC